MPFDYANVQVWLLIYQITEKINHPMYIDDIKLFANNEIKLVTLIQMIRIKSQDIGNANNHVLKPIQDP